MFENIKMEPNDLVSDPKNKAVFKTGAEGIASGPIEDLTGLGAEIDNEAKVNLQSAFKQPGGAAEAVSGNEDSLESLRADLHPEMNNLVEDLKKKYSHVPIGELTGEIRAALEDSLSMLELTGFEVEKSETSGGPQELVN